MKPRRNSNSEDNRAATASLLADLEEEFSTITSEAAFTPALKSKASDESVSNETRNKPVTNPEQTRNKPVMEFDETRNKPVIETRNENHQNPETRNKPVTKPVMEFDETRNKPVMAFSFASATQFQKQILLCVYREMQKSVDRLTPPMSLQHFGQYLGRVDSKGFESLRIVSLRLEQMGLLLRPVIKNGRGGWTRYSLPQPVYAEIRDSETRNEIDVNPEQTRNKPVTKPVMDGSSSSSSISLYNKTTTTSDVEKFEFKLDEVLEFGLTASAVSRCFELYPNIENEKMQDLLNRFAQFMRSSEGKRVKNARGFLISLAEQMSKGMTPLDHIETPEAILMREMVVKKRAQKAEQELLEKEMQDFDFEEWWSELLPQDRDALIPPNNIASPGSNSQKLLAKQVHAEKFWPERKKRALDSGAEV